MLKLINLRISYAHLFVSTPVYVLWVGVSFGLNYVYLSPVINKYFDLLLLSELKREQQIIDREYRWEYFL